MAAPGRRAMIWALTISRPISGTCRSRASWREATIFELRIIGDAIVQAYGENFTGRTLSSIAEFVGDAVVAAYHSIVLEGGPVVLHGSFERPRNHHFRRELVLMPLGAPIGVEFVLSAGMLTPHYSDMHTRTDPAENPSA